MSATPYDDFEITTRRPGGPLIDALQSGVHRSREYAALLVNDLDAGEGWTDHRDGAWWWYPGTVAVQVRYSLDGNRDGGVDVNIRVVRGAELTSDLTQWLNDSNAHALGWWWWFEQDTGDVYCSMRTTTDAQTWWWPMIMKLVLPHAVTVAESMAPILADAGGGQVAVESHPSRGPRPGVDGWILVDDVVAGYQKGLEGLEDLDEREAERDAAFLAAHQDAVQEEFDYVFDDTPRTADSDEILRGSIPLLVLGKRESWGSDSTLAFIGYGGDDTFPGHQTLALTGLVNDRVMIYRWEETRVSVANESLLTPFAQDEAIHTFLRAYNRQFPGIGHDSIDALVEEFAARFDIDREILEELRQQAHKEFADNIESWSWQQFISPMLDTVGSLPLIDLARMAESLVGIQALRAQSTTQQPSVGGNIALLTISPENGVTWLRRHTEPSSLTSQGASA